MTDLDNFVGIERSLSAVSDLETPSKKLLLKIAQDAGSKWAEENNVDFNFVDNSVESAIKYYENESNTDGMINGANEHKLFPVMIFGFIAGVIDKINEKNQKTN